MSKVLNPTLAQVRCMYVEVTGEGLPGTMAYTAAAQLVMDKKGYEWCEAWIKVHNRDGSNL